MSNLGVFGIIGILIGIYSLRICLITNYNNPIPLNLFVVSMNKKTWCKTKLTMKKLMLIIEDNNFMKILLGNLFSLHYNIHTVSNGHEALEWLYSGNMPNVIISDIVMPEMDGLEFLKNIRGSTFFNNIPLVMLSGVDKSSDRIKCLQLGANDYIIKPFNPEELTIRIHNLLKSA